MRRAGRPGLIGTMARTAVISGTATAVGGGVARRQSARHQERAQTQAQAQAYEEAQQQAAMQAQMQAAAQQAAAQQAAAAPPAPAAPATDDPIAKLKELADLKAAGVLTEDEFALMKAKILGS